MNKLCNVLTCTTAVIPSTNNISITVVFVRQKLVTVDVTLLIVVVTIS